MKKFFVGLVAILIVVAGLGIYLVWTNLDALVRDAIEHYGTQVTQTAVNVDDVEIRLREGKGAIHGTTVANPEGFEGPYAFSLGEIATDIDLSSLTEDVIVIDEIVVEKPRVSVIVSEEGKMNLRVLQQNIAAGTGKAPPDRPPAESGRAEPRLIIRRLRFANGEIDALIRPLEKQEYQLELPTIEMTGLGGETGATPPEIARQILGRLTEQAIEVIRSKGIDEQLQRLESKARGELDEGRQEIREKLDVRKEEAKEKLKGLLGD